MDQSKLPKDNAGQLPCKVMGCNGLDRSNNDDRRRRMGGGGDLEGIVIAENNARQWQRDQDGDRIGSRRNATMTTSTTMKAVENHDKDYPPRGGKIRKEG